MLHRTLELVMLCLTMSSVYFKVAPVQIHADGMQVSTPGTTDANLCSKCLPGSEPNCNTRPGLGTGCSVCMSGSFSLGGSEPCRPCSSCPPGKGSVSLCTLTKDTVCDDCTEGETYSSESSQERCDPCSDCLSETSSQCTVVKDTQCNDNHCPTGQYWNNNADTCFPCSTDTAEKPECNQPRGGLYPGHRNEPSHHNVSASAESNVVIIVGSTVGFALTVTISMVVVCLHKWRCRARSPCWQRLQQTDGDQQSQPTGEMKLLEKSSLVKDLPNKAKDNLAIVFMQQDSRVYYRTMGGKFGLSDEDISTLSVYCQNTQWRGFSDTFYECLETRKPGMTLSDLCEILVDCVRADLISCLRTWAMDENVDLQVSDSDFISDSEILVSSDQLLSERIVLLGNDRLSLLGNRRRDSLSSIGQCSPTPGTPPS